MLWSQEGLERLLHLLGNMEMPLGIYYTDVQPAKGITPARGKHECIINIMRKSRAQNVPAFFAADMAACMGGWLYLGFSEENKEKIADFVTTGFPDREGERYMPEPASMHRLFDDMGLQKAPGQYCVVKPLNLFRGAEQPDLVTFYARSERMAGLCHRVFRFG